MRFLTAVRNCLKNPTNSDIYYKLVSIKSGRSLSTEPVFVSTKSDKRNLPQSPSNIFAEYDGENSMKLYWDYKDDVDYYLIYCSMNGYDYFWKVKNFSGNERFKLNKDKGYIDLCNLKSNSTYYYKIKAVKNGSESNFTDVVAVSTKSEIEKEKPEIYAKYRKEKWKC